MNAADVGVLAYVWPCLMMATFLTVLTYAAVDGRRVWRSTRDGRAG